MQPQDQKRTDTSENLARVRALSAEVAAAISALVRNDLPELEACLAAQESLCRELLDKNSKVVSRARESAQNIARKSGETLDSLLKEDRSDIAALAHLNRVYDGLLKSAMRTVALRSALCRCYRQSYEKAPTQVVDHHTWSCEV
jgi:hypothetical protein